MSFTPKDLVAALGELEAVAGSPERYVVAFSGGLDSTALLSLLVASADLHRKPLLAVHVDHQLQAESADWSRRCREIATTLGVPFACESVEVSQNSGQGPEASAREARYAALSKYVGAGTWLLSAHHRDDQAETLLINLLRGSGPAGVAGIPGIRPFGDGWIVRPLLGVGKKTLQSCVDASALPWIDDPSNDESAFDRNFLRNNVLPLLEERWPNASSRLGRSAAYAREAAELVTELADHDIETLGGDASRLNLTGLRTLSVARAKNVLRRAVSRCGLAAMPSPKLQCIVDELLTAREDATPLVRWGTAEARRYRDTVYLLRSAAQPSFDGVSLSASPIAVGDGMGRLSLVTRDGPGLSRAVVDAGLTLRLRQGGEEIRLVGQPHTKKLKKLLQEEGIVPWVRDRLPLVYSGASLVAVADLWLSNDAVEDDGFAVHWSERPCLK